MTVKGERFNALDSPPPAKPLPINFPLRIRLLIALLIGAFASQLLLPAQSLIGFSELGLWVSEETGLEYAPQPGRPLKATVVRSGSMDQAVTVRLKTEPGTAAPGLDFEAVDQLLTFAPGESLKSVDFRVINDQEEEAEVEEFFLRLEATGSSQVELTNSTLWVNIRDTDVEWEFTASEFVASEGSDSVTVSIGRKLFPTGRRLLAGTPPVLVVTADGTASSPTDYEAVRQLTIPTYGIHDYGTIAYLKIPIHRTNDATYSPEKAFNVSLEGITNGVLFGSLRNAKASIVDNDTVLGPGRAVEGYVRAVIAHEGGWLIGGTFERVDGTPKGRLALLSRDGELISDRFPGLGADGPITALARDQQGRILAAGTFKTFNGGPANSLVRLLPDGSVDPEFDSGSGLPPDPPPQGRQLIEKILPLPDGGILLAGTFAKFNKTTAPSLIKLNPGGSVDTNFSAAIASTNGITALSAQLDGRILVGGALSAPGATTRRAAMRLFSDGSVDSGFNLPVSPVGGGAAALYQRRDGMIWFVNRDGSPPEESYLLISAAGSILRQPPKFVVQGRMAHPSRVFSGVLLEDDTLWVAAETIDDLGQNWRRVTYRDTGVVTEVTIINGGYVPLVDARQPDGELLTLDRGYPPPHRLLRLDRSGLPIQDLTFQPVVMMDNGEVHLGWRGQLEAPFVVESSSDLRSWKVEYWSFNPNGGKALIRRNLTEPQLYFRARTRY